MTAAAAGQGPKARPILMSAPMVRALIDGRKTQTRRIVKNPPRLRAAGWSKIEYGPICSQLPRACPYGQPGDLLWVRETWQGFIQTSYEYDEWREVETSDIAEGPHFDVEYKATSDSQPSRWRPSIHMPRHASRLTLELTGVRVERLQDISEADAKAEGLATLTKDNGRSWKFGIPDADGLPGNDDFGWHWQEWEVDPRKAYARLWESINGAGSWAANPWVWCLQFEVHHQNVDALIQQRRAAA